MTQHNELQRLTERLREFANQRVWEPFHSPKNLSMALIVEAAELVEHFQWLTEQESRELDAETQAQVELELADIFIYLLRLADQLNVDLVPTAYNKIELNERRYPVEQVRGKAKVRQAHK